jgi:hypothetical protein
MLALVFSIMLAAYLRRTIDRYCEKFTPKLDTNDLDKYCGVSESSCAIVGSETLEYTVCDYASGTNIMTEDKRLFSIYF